MRAPTGAGGVAPLPHYRPGQTIVDLSPHPGDVLARPQSGAHRAGIFAEGSRLGPYVLGPCIGHGSSGRIYRAEHEAIDRALALKVFTDEQSRSAAARSLFVRQARRAATIRHPSLVEVFDVGIHDGVPYVVMELLDGEGLDTLLHTRGALDEAAIVDVIIPILAGLSALHEHGVVHGDVKTKNVFLAYRSLREREPKLLDFGTSRYPDVDVVPGASGTRGVHRDGSMYVAPELLRGGGPSALSDQYSLGVVLYECAVGLNPFASDSSSETSRRIREADYPPLSFHQFPVSDALVRVVERAMSLDPESRYPDLKTLGRELLSCGTERTRMTWTFSLGAPAEPRGGEMRSASVLSAARRALEELGSGWARHLDWGTAAALAFGLVTFGWAIAILLAR